MNNQNKILTAPCLNRYIEILKDRNVFTDKATTERIKHLFDVMSCVCEEGSRNAPDDYYKHIYISVPRGAIEEFGDYNEYYEDGEVESREEFEDLWKDYYPDEVYWYKIGFTQYKQKYFIFVNDALIFQCETLNDNYTFVVDSSYIYSFIDALCGKIQESVNLLKAGEYNDYIERNLPYKYRYGLIKMKDYWDAVPDAKRFYTEDIKEQYLERLHQYMSESRHKTIKEMTANIFFEACTIGYKENQYVGREGLSAVEQYLRYADGRDAGLTKLPGDDPKAFEEWMQHEWMIGHPWEVVAGGNSTHIDLYVIKDEEAPGWYFMICGDHRIAEAVRFYVALHEHGYPVILNKAQDLYEVLTGDALLGIVPEYQMPFYAERNFSPDYKVFNFMHLDRDEESLIFPKVKWLKPAFVELKRQQ